MKYPLSNRKAIPKISCVYKITHIDSGKYYIGSSKNLRQRMYDHTKNPKYLTYLKKALFKHGLYRFDVEIVAQPLCNNRGVLFDIEQDMFDQISDWSFVYNTNKKAFVFDYDDPEHQRRQKESLEFLRKSIEQYNMNGEFVRSFVSLDEAEQHGYDHSKVSICCNRKRRSAYNFQWRFTGDAHDITPYKRTNIPTKIEMLDKKTLEPIATFYSSYQAAKWYLAEIGEEISEQRAGRIALKMRIVARGKRNSAYGYKWRAIEE